MYRIVFSKSSIVILFTLFFFSCKSNENVLPYYNSPDFTPHFINNKATIEKQISHKIGAFAFQDQDGKIISDKHLLGKIHVANFVFTSCGSICPKMTENLLPISHHFKNNSKVVFLSFSVTPWIDSVPVLKNYYIKNQIDNPHWHFLTGSKDKIYDLARTSYFAEEDLGFSKDSADFLHTEHTLLIDPDLRIRGIYNGTLKTDMNQLQEDITTLLNE